MDTRGGASGSPPHRQDAGSPLPPSRSLERDAQTRQEEGEEMLLLQTGMSVQQSAVAGALAGGLSRLLTAPFDLVKIRFQLQVGPINTPAQRKQLAYPTVSQAFRKIVREEGLVGLWRGNLAATYLWIGYGGVQFPVYERMKADMQGTWLEPAGAFIAGAGAGFLATVVTYPLDVIRSQFAAQGVPRAHEGMVSFVRFILDTQGVPGLFAGLAPTALQIIPRMGLSFFVYEKLEEGTNATTAATTAPGETAEADQWQVVKRWLLSACNGAMAGAVARVVVHPLDTVKRRMQAQVMVQKRSGMYGYLPTFRSSLECLQHIVANEGMAALYKGLVPTLMKAAVATSTTFAFYDVLKAAVVFRTNNSTGGRRPPSSPS